MKRVIVILISIAVLVAGWFAWDTYRQTAHPAQYAITKLINSLELGCIVFPIEELRAPKFGEDRGCTYKGSAVSIEGALALLTEYAPGHEARLLPTHERLVDTMRPWELRHLATRKTVVDGEFFFRDDGWLMHIFFSENN